MGRIAFHERPEFLRGRAGEQRVSAWFQERGWYVIPSYDYSGSERDKAPKLKGLLDGFPVPDLDIARNGCRRWVEVKVKKSAIMGIISGEPEHGIEHYDDYMRVARETGTEAWLAILEEDTGKLWGQSFNGLGEPRRSRMNGKSMAFFVCRKFIHLDTFPEVTGGPDS